MSDCVCKTIFGSWSRQCHLLNGTGTGWIQQRHFKYVLKSIANKIFEALPVLEDERFRSLQHLLVELMPCVLMVAPASWHLLSCISVYISAHNGNSGPGSAYMMVLYAYNLCNPDLPNTNLSLGIQFGQFAISVLQRFTELSSASKTYVAYGAMRALVDSFSAGLKYFELAIKYSIASHTGDYLAFA